MDIIRYALLAGLAVVTYLLLLAWQEDYGVTDTPAPEEIVTTSSSAPDDTAEDTGTDLPTTAPASDGDDIPSVTTSPDSDREVQTSGSEELINVQTDVLNVRIDPVGGDIVYISLPRYPTELDRPDEPFVLLEETSLRSYVAQSGLVGRDGIDTGERPRYTTRSTDYVLGPDGRQLQVELEYTDEQGVSITKRFTFTRGDYLIDVAYEVDNPTDERWRANLFGQIKRGDFADPTTGSGFGMQSFLGFATTAPDDNYIKIDFDEVESRAPHEMEGGWMAFSQHYFLSAWVAPQTNNRFSTRINNQGEYIGGFTSDEFAVPSGETATRSAGFYAGPKDQYRLAEIAPWLDRTIDYGWLWFIASPIYWLLTFINSFVGNYGWSILLLTVCVKGIFYKLSATSYRSMANMRRVMPKMNQLKERFGDDKMRLQKETMELYKKEKINPFGGCLPILVQMPVFIALYWVLLESVELRHAPFILWIDDLSVMDPYFVLPILMGASMYLQFMLSPTPQDPTQAKIMKFMPVVMTVFFLWFPAGLVLYWLANSVLGIAQQWYITSGIEKEQARKDAARV
ncbi:MAG: membrane protein insertase YidC [Pseudohongiellaceae bacterium]